MNIFKIHSDVVGQYSSYISSFLEISDERIRNVVDEYFTSHKLWPQPLIQFNPAFAPGKSIDELCESGVLHSELKNVFKGYQLYNHQVEALQHGSAGENFIVTSGTGSGKSLTYIGTIFHHLLSETKKERGIKALIVYPMNALINSQKLALDEYKKKYEEQTNKQFPITYERYTGQESYDEKEKIKSDLPDIILTNYMMLELIMTRLNETELRNSISDNLRFLVFDELHTYRGRQGSDVSFLIRRINSATKKKLICIGTSATMVSGKSIVEQKKVVAGVAQNVFGQEFTSENIVNEKLVRSLSSDDFAIEESQLMSELQNGNISGWSIDKLLNSSIAKWLETEIALEDYEGELIRRGPLLLNEISKKLSDHSGMEANVCEEKVKEILNLANDINTNNKNSENPILPFKVHQFFSQTGSVYITLESGEKRHITMEPSGFIKGDADSKIALFPVVFSRTSGVDFICVRKNISEDRFDPREFTPRVPDEDDENTQSGYVVFEKGEDSFWKAEDINNLPDSWVNIKSNGEIEIKKDYKKRIPEKISFDEYGNYTSNVGEYSNVGWYMSAPLLFDPSSGMFYDRKTSEGTKLSKLGTEGRSTATTILSYSTIKALHDERQKNEEQKLLSFTDNRQDAALQAGHFNDFYKVGKLRSAIYYALLNADEKRLDYSIITQKVFDTLRVPQEQFAKNPSPLPFQAEENETAFKHYLNYRILSDLKRGWRVTLPNLEQCGLLRIEYKYLKETCEIEDFWKDVPIIGNMNLETRMDFITQLLDYFRKNYAISHSSLEPDEIGKISRIIRDEVKQEWGLDKDEKIEFPYAMRVETIQYTNRKIYTASIGPQSYFGKYIKAIGKNLNVQIDKKNYSEVVHIILDKLVQAKWISFQEIKQRDSKTKLFRLEVKALQWVLGDGESVVPDKIRFRSYKENVSKANEFFRNFYMQNFSEIKLMEAKEHTAQIKNEDREDREEKFRNGDISLLCCSPTMELGIDISSLNVVHMRNVPPNPSNYAQRSGRAGRSGQAALVMTFCSNFSPHDKHYFNNPAAMVSGVVSPSRIDLVNEELINTHLNAIYLAEVGLKPLEKSIEDLLNTDDYDNLPLKDSIIEKLTLPEAKKKLIFSYFKEALSGIEDKLINTHWYNNNWIFQQIEAAPDKFDKAIVRWRILYQAAHRQLNRAQETINNPIYTSESQEKRQAYAEQKQANKQIDLLRNQGKGTSSFSEFYPYRYLAAEGFLPGYNFTRLPIRVFIPKGEDGEFFSRPRFLAIREFGPGNIIYHDGSRYKISQLIQHEMESKIHKMKVSKGTGYALLGEDYNLEYCPFSNVYLQSDKEREIYTDLLPISENRTYQIDRISCEEEERLSLGFEMSAYFSVEGPKDRVQTVHINDGKDSLLKIRYIPAATLIKINEKWRNHKEPGFLINMKTGFWKSEKDLKKEDEKSNIKRVRLVAKDTADALYIHPLKALALKEGNEYDSIITLQFALKRAIENIYQIETAEIGVEVMGDTDKPNLLIYEAAEGSLGILSQIIEEPSKFNEIVKEAYRICYFENGEDTNPDAGPATYNDLLSYYNQRYHMNIDRHLIKDQLERLMLCSMESLGNSPFESYDEQYQFLMERIDPNSSTEKKFLKYLYDHGLKLPDEAQFNPGEIYVKPDFYYKKENACIFCDGTPHDDPEIKKQDKLKREALFNKGYDVVEYYYKDTLDNLVETRSDIFKKVK